MKAGTIVLIEAGDRHEIRNTGRTLLKTVSVLVPPAYREIRSPTRQSSLVLGCLEDLQAMHCRRSRFAGRISANPAPITTSRRDRF